ncbi:nuclear transport factor 2 family protein [Microbacterium sp. QXD-8]|uniref:Nuclear transport factor 2 family protein n=1 Tax=Microbacterium psychrotolerans TaxID=3068321 RepID=A0ABU0Z338_9MICO|nr:nuclear transport factor 2 family protein [Microbacterium sp. QXD-8]MDQ7879012.1 nuclear transport factor 2 family protein [Microbacterium sp. QXD-8]
MTGVVLPTAIREFVDATNRGDSDAFLEAFSDDPILDDWGRVFVGREGVAAWNRSDNIGQRSHFEVVGVEAGAEPDSHVVTVRVTGGGYNGTSPITFRLREGKIDRLIIAPS